MGFFKPNIEKMLTRQDVEGLIKALKHKDFEVRKGAADALGKIGGTKAVESLIGALRDEDRDVRMEAAKALGEIGNARAVGPLINAMADKNTDVRKASEKALVEIAGRIGPLAKAAVPVLTEALRSAEDKDVRRSAALALAKIGPAAKSSVPALTMALGDDNPKVREASARALDKIGVDEETTRAALLKRLKDSNAKVRKVAAAAIGGELGNIYTQVERLKAAYDWDAAARLAKIGKAAVPALVDTLNYQGRDSSFARGGAAEALGEIGDTRAVEPLIQALKDKDYDVRRHAAEALGEIGDTRAVGPLLQALKDKDDAVRRYGAEALGEVRREAACALGKIKDARAVEPLIQALTDVVGEVRSAAAEALGKIRDARTAQPLVRALKDKDEDVRVKATGTLGRTDDARMIAPLLECMFANPGDRKAPVAEALRKLAPNSTLTEEIISAATKAAKYQTFYSDESIKDRVRFLEASNEAVKTLCSIKSSAASNILHLVAKRRDVKVFLSWCAFADEEKVDFKEQREMALDELARRDSPPYDPSAFLKSSDQKA